MKAMPFSVNPAFRASVILHLALIVLLFLITVAKFFLPKEQVHVFEMVSPPAPSNPRQDSVSAEPLPDLVLPDVKPLEIPTPVVPKVEPVEPPVEPPVKLPVEPPVKPPVEPPVKPPVEPPVKPPVEPKKEKLMSYTDFLKENPKSSKPRKTQSSKTSLNVPTINTEKFSANLESKLKTVDKGTTNTLTSDERSALQRYGDQLNRRLNSAWMKPANLSGLNLEVTVVFDVSSSGRISNIRFHPGSGNASFDESVKAAFSKVGSGGITPTGQSHTFTMSFKMVN